MLIMIVMLALACASCSDSEDRAPAHTAEPAQEPLPPLPPPGTGPPAAPSTAGPDQSPYVTGGSGRRVPSGYTTEITLGGQTATIPFTQLGALTSRRDSVSFLLTAEPSLDAERLGPNRFPSLSVAWDVSPDDPSDKPSSKPSGKPLGKLDKLDDLAGRTFELDEVGLGRVVIRLDGKEYMAKRFKLAFDGKADDTALAGSFSGIVGEFQPRKSMKPMGELEVTGTFRAFPGGWANLRGGD
jgi:hypothetical protein